MKKILFLVMAALPLCVIAQKWQDPLLYGEMKNGVGAKRTLLMPTGCGNPSALNAIDSAKKMAGAYFDSCNHRYWLYDPKTLAWDSLHLGVAGSSGGGTWGSITGTLSAQTDLQAVLDAKVNITDTSFMLANYLRGATEGWGMNISGTQHKTWEVDSSEVATQFDISGFQNALAFPYTTNKYLTGYNTFGSLLDTIRTAISLTTTGTSGAATYNSSTGVLNVPQYSTSAALTSTQIGFGSGANLLTGSSNLTFDNSTGYMTMGGVAGEPRYILNAGINGNSFMSFTEAGTQNWLVGKGLNKDYRWARYNSSGVFQATDAYFEYSTGNLLLNSLKTGSTAPTTSGTTKMVISDANGRVSFTTIPTGGIASLASVGGGLDIQTGGAGNVRTLSTNNFSVTTNLIDIKTQMSITSDASGLKLSGDASTPGNSYLYGTNGSGTKGWYAASTYAASSKLNSITAADGTNTIDNATYAQEWQWNSLAGASALKLSTTSTAAASGLQKMLEITMTGANANASQETNGLYISNAHTGAGLNYGARFTATGGATNTGVHSEGDTYGIIGKATGTGGISVYGLMSAPGGTSFDADVTSTVGSPTGYVASVTGAADNNTGMSLYVINGTLSNVALKIQEGEFRQNESTAPGTPPSGFGTWYVSTAGKPRFINDGGTDYDLTAGGGGGITSLTSVGGGLDIQTAGAGDIRTLNTGEFSSSTNLISVLAIAQSKITDLDDSLLNKANIDGSNAYGNWGYYRLIGTNVTGGLRNYGAVTSAVDNFALGYDLFNTLTSGSLNINIGKNSLRRVTSGSEFINLGYNNNINVNASNLNSAPGITIGSNINGYIKYKNLGIGHYLIGSNVDSVDAVAYSRVVADNMAIGVENLINLYSGNDNMVFSWGGLESLDSGSNNNVFGQYGLPVLDDGKGNNAFGFKAGRRTNHGDKNSFFGDSAGTGSSSVTMNRSTFLGASTGFTGTGLNLRTAVGYGAIVSQDNFMALGGVGTRVGIGRATALEQLHLDSAIIIGPRATTTDGTIAYQSNAFVFRQNGVDVALSGGSGTISSGTTGKPAYYTAGTTLDDFAAIDYATSGVNVTMTPLNTTDNLFLLQGISSFTGNYMEVRDVSTALLTSINSDGELLINTTDGGSYTLQNGGASWFKGNARFTGTPSGSAASLDRVDIGVEAGTPRMYFEDNGATIWAIDNNAGVFRWFTPGVVQFDLSTVAGSFANGLQIGSTLGGSPSPRQLHVTEDNATNNAVTYIARYSHTTSGSPANGIGIGTEWNVETSSGNNEIGAVIDIVTTDVTAASEDFDYVIKLMAAGATANEKLRLISTGQLKLPIYTTTTSFVVTPVGMLVFDASGNIGTAAISSGGETNTGSNLGGGLDNYSTKVGVDLRFNTFAAADFDLASNLITIDATKWLTITAAAAAYQPLNSNLTTIAGLTATTDNFIVGVASAWASRTPSQVRTTLALVIGTDVQAWDTDLDTWKTITPAAGVGTFLATPSSANLITAVTDETGTGSLVFGTSPTLTTPKIASGGFIADANGNELVIYTTTASAVNELTFANGATGVNPLWTASGETNVGIDWKVKGTGVFNFLATTSGPTDIRWFEDADNGTNYTSLISTANIASNIVVTLPNASSTLPIFGQQITFAGPTSARTVTFPDASFTVARTDAANTFTGIQTMTSPALTTPDITTGFKIGGAAATGTFPRGDGTNFIASTLTLPNAATTGDILTATGTNAIGVVAAVATGSFLISQGTGTAPVYQNTRENWTTFAVSGSNATTTGQSLVDVTGLTSGTLTNSTLYEVEAWLNVTTSAVTTGCQYAITAGGSGGAAVVQAMLIGNSTGTTMTNENIVASATATTARLLTSGQSGMMYIHGWVTTRGAGTANISIQHLKVTSGTSTVLIGSKMKIRLAN